MKEKFDVVFLPYAVKFMEQLEKSAQRKIYYNMRKVQFISDPELFKKLTHNIWEFRTYYNKTYYRLFAFWEKNEWKETMVFVTHGLIKKSGRTPIAEIEKAERIRQKYLSQ